MSGQTQSVFTQLSIGGVKYCFVKIEDKSNFSLVDGSNTNNCGTPYHSADDVDDGPRIPRLHILMQPSPEEIDVLLPWLGFAEDADVFTPITDFSAAALKKTVIVDRVAKVHSYTNCHVDKFIFRGARGTEPVSLEIQCIAEGFSEGNAGTFSGTAVSGASAPYAFNRGTLTLAASTYGFNSFVFAGDFHLNPEHNHNQYPTAIEIGDITYHFGHSSPYTATEAGLLSTKISDPATGIAGDLEFVRGDKSTTIAFYNLKSGAILPSIPGKPHEVREQHMWNVYGDADNRPVEITNDLGS